MSQDTTIESRSLECADGDSDLPRHRNPAACRLAEMVIADLAGETLVQHEIIAALKVQVDFYRTLSTEAMVVVGRQGRELHTLRATHHRLLEERRTAREIDFRRAS